MNNLSDKRVFKNRPRNNTETTLASKMGVKMLRERMSSLT